MIKVNHIAKRYGKNEILKDISFEISPNEIVCIIGRNGCGKSTLMQVLAGAIKPDFGELLYSDKNPLRNRSVFGKDCGFVPQGNPFIEELSVIDNLKLFGADKTVLQEEFLAEFELKEILKMQVKKLSGGMKRRAAIACAVVQSPDFLIMDEPTTALDLYYKTKIHDWMKAYREKGGMILLTTHDEQEIMLCDRCYVMQNGMLKELTKEEQNPESIRRYIMEKEDGEYRG